MVHSSQGKPWSAARRAAAQVPMTVQIRKRAVVQQDGCWLWTRCLNEHGYGLSRLGGPSSLAHRLSYAAFKGPITPNMMVLHRCDVRACVNPAHLFLGTHQDNMADMKSKGRASRKGSYRGPAHPGSRLTLDQVRAIRASSESSYKLAGGLKVSPSLIRQIRRGEAWSHAQ